MTRTAADKSLAAGSRSALDPDGTSSGLAEGAVRVDDLARQLRALGVIPGDLLVVHTSFRAVRPVENGPSGLIEALQLAARGGTILMPSWPERAVEPFDTRRTPVSRDLGVVAEVFRTVPNAVRANHAASFAAWGPRASELLRDPMPLPPHRLESPVGRAWQLDGKVLLLGVGHEANTTIHLAEVLQAVPYGIEHRCRIRDSSGERVIAYFENDHCCERFALLDAWLDDHRTGAQSKGPVGAAAARLVSSRALVSVARAELEKDPLVFLHPPGACSECDQARSSIPSGRTLGAHRDLSGPTTSSGGTRADSKKRT